MPTINNLLYTDTFKTWFDRTNTVISTINGITVYNIIAGDGIGVTSTNGIFTINHGPNVSTGVTFTGSVNFNGAVSFAQTPNSSATTVNVSPKITGLTAGNVVRIETTGLTLAKADSRPNAEVLGVIINETASSHVVAVNGSITNSVFANTISNALGIVGGTLLAGQPYFLDPVRAGGITLNEPNTYGYVSKPVILGISGNVGTILQYRGIEIAGITAGLTAELDNKIIVSVDYSGNIGGTPITTRCPDINSPIWPVTVGTPVWIIPTPTGDIDSALDSNFWDLGHAHMFGRVNGGNSFLTAFKHHADGWGYNANCSPQKQLYGLISKILVNDTVNKIWVFEITKPGGSFLAKYSELLHPSIKFYNPSILKGGPFFLASLTDDNSDGGFFQNFMYCSPFWEYQFNSVNYDGLNYLTVTPIGDAQNTLNIYLEPLAPRHNLITISGYTAGINYGSCAITEIQNLTEGGSGSGGGGGGRPGSLVRGLTGALEYLNLIPNGSFSVWQRGVTAINTSTGTTKTGWAFADCWWATNNKSATGLTLNFERKAFSSSQTDVPGSPLYYVDCSTKYTSITNSYDRARLENIQREARLLQGQQATISFWAKSTTSGSTLDVAYTRYSDTMTTARVQNAISYRTIPVSGITLDGTWRNYKYSFTVSPVSGPAGFPLGETEKGWFGIGFEFPSTTGVTYSIAQVQVQLGTSVVDSVYTPPEKELERCRPYYLRTYDLDQATGFIGSSTLNEQILQLGNLLTQRDYVIKFPVQITDIPYDSNYYKLYSPFTGQEGDAFNVNAGTDMRNSGVSTVNLPWNPSTYRTTSAWPSPNISIVSVSENGMTVRIHNGATHLDTLKFHYVIDAGPPLGAL